MSKRLWPCLLVLWACDDGGGGDPRHIQAPPDAEVDAAPTTRANACASDDDCAEGTCRTDGWPGGHCTVSGCLDAGCGDGEICVEDGDGGICVAACADDTCREGYACREGACLPEEPADARWDGAPCFDDDDCAGGSCMQAPDWPGGHCTTTACETRDDCSADPAGVLDLGCFISVREDNFCVRACDADADCRFGYVCEQIDGAGVCLPDPEPPLIREPDALDHPLDITCVDAEEARRLPYEVGADAYSYFVVPFSPGGKALEPKGIELPDGEMIDLREGDNAFQLTNNLLHGYMNATQVPGVEAFSAQKRAGLHHYLLEPRAERVCSYVLQTDGPGTRLDLNIYFVGLEELNADNARDDFDFNAMLERFELSWKKMGVSLGEVRVFDAEPRIAERYRVVHNDREVAALLETTRRPGDTRDDVLSVNVMLVAGFAVPRHPLLGSSEGLPGPAGLHGTRTSGVVVTAEYLGSFFGLLNGNDYTGDTLAHEVGHYLGLLHTTEQTQAHFDPLDDTPRCGADATFPDGCPDRGNLMFPLASMEEPQVSEGQAWIVRANPLTKE